MNIRVNVGGTLVHYRGRIDLAGTLYPFTGLTFPTDDAHGPLHSIPIAVYRGNATLNAPRKRGESPGSVADYEAWSGRSLLGAMEYLASDNLYNQTYPSWVSQPWQASGRRIILGGCGTPVASDTWAGAASGAYDATWRKMCSNLAAAGQRNPILRPAHEFNGYFEYSKRALSHKTDFIAAWRRFVEIVRADLPGATIVWNPAASGSTDNAWSSMYPGDRYVDQIGIDFYDNWYNNGWLPGTDSEPSLKEREAVWAWNLPSMNSLAAFARTRAKPLCAPEWGFLNDVRDPRGVSHSGGDNDHFVNQGASWIAANHAVWQAFWDNIDQGVYDPDTARGRMSIPVPKSRIALHAAIN